MEAIPWYLVQVPTYVEVGFTPVEVKNTAIGVGGSLHGSKLESKNVGGRACTATGNKIAVWSV